MKILAVVIIALSLAGCLGGRDAGGDLWKIPGLGQPK